jgi:2-C-methyl-D-erythritol 2,4-cyclodiphosphate synthase
VAVTRAGLGFDVHAFGGDGPLLLGGVEIPYEHGLAGHSDADVVCHAIGDALLGAAGLGDLGEMFPATDDRRGASSIGLLEEIVAGLTSRGWGVVNVDVTVVAREPRLSPYRTEMAGRIAGALGVDAAVVSVKATTTDGLGFTGRGEGIASMAVALIENVG